LIQDRILPIDITRYSDKKLDPVRKRFRDEEEKS